MFVTRLVTKFGSGQLLFGAPGANGKETAMSTAKKNQAGKRRKRNRILFLAVLVFGVYVVVMLTQLQLELNERQQALHEVNTQITEQQRANEDLQDKIDNYEKYLEEQVRQQGMARPGEIIFQEIPGAE